MSWLYSRALVEEYLGDICSDGEQSAPLSGNHTQLAYLPPDKMTDFSRLSRFGMTFKPLTENRGEELLTLYLEDFRAKTYLQQEKAQELTEKEVECGKRWHGLLAKYDQDSCSWKTPQCSLLEDSEPSLEIWPRWGSMQNGESFLRPIPALRTSESESGWWPTPRSCSAMGAEITPENAWNEKRFPNLETVVGQRMWPTPNAGHDKWQGTIGEWGGSQNWVRTEMPEFARGLLNPTWVEWLMGWPLGWTDLKPLETDKFQEWRQQHLSY